eukprot:460513_1
MDTFLEKVDKAFSRYYEMNGVRDYFEEDGEGKFKIFCEENGIEDEEAINDELGAGAEDCILVEFDEDDFPGIANADDEKEAIFEVIKECVAAPETAYIHGYILPKFNDSFFAITEEETKKIGKIYETNAMLNWNSIPFTLCVGYKHKLDYLINLLDTDCRDKLNCKKHNVCGFNKRHLRTITNEKYREKVQSEINIIEKRIFGFSLKLVPHNKTHDSLKITTIYIVDMILFVDEIIKTKLCPFQIDFCIIQNNPLTEEEKSNTTSDTYVEYQKHGNKSYDIGNVKYIIQKLKLRHVILPIDFSNAFKTYNRGLKEFRAKLLLNDYPNRRRCIIMIDRRNTKQDELIFYEPPMFLKYIPKLNVSEWYLLTSMRCILPNAEYIQDVKQAADQNILREIANKIKERDEKMREFLIKLRNEGKITNENASLRLYHRRLLKLGFGHKIDYKETEKEIISKINKYTKRDQALKKYMKILRQKIEQTDRNNPSQKYIEFLQNIHFDKFNQQMITRRVKAISDDEKWIWWYNKVRYSDNNINNISRGYHTFNESHILHSIYSTHKTLLHRDDSSFTQCCEDFVVDITKLSRPFDEDEFGEYYFEITQTKREIIRYGIIFTAIGNIEHEPNLGRFFEVEIVAQYQFDIDKWKCQLNDGPIHKNDYNEKHKRSNIKLTTDVAKLCCGYIRTIILKKNKNKFAKMPIELIKVFVIYCRAYDEEPLSFDISKHWYSRNQKRVKIIKSNTDCKGTLLTLSFHAMSENHFKVYLYKSISTNRLRFFETDIIDVVPQLFDEKWNNSENDVFAKSNEIKQLLQKIKGKIRDQQFEAFYDKFKCKNNFQ